jgi:hypothetical protein
VQAGVYSNESVADSELFVMSSMVSIRRRRPVLDELSGGSSIGPHHQLVERMVGVVEQRIGIQQWIEIDWVRGVLNRGYLPGDGCIVGKWFGGVRVDRSCVDRICVVGSCVVGSCVVGSCVAGGGLLRSALVLRRFVGNWFGIGVGGRNADWIGLDGIHVISR